MELKRIDAVSCAKVFGILYGGIGLLIGGLFSLFALLGVAIGSAEGGEGDAMIAAFVGVGAVVIFPVIYGVMGVVSGLVLSLLYNFVAKVFGGVRVELG